MKLFIATIAALVACASAGHVQFASGPLAVAPVSSGSSSQFRSQDNHGNYQFGYDESHATGSSSRREERSGDVVRGSYRLGDLDGRARTVHYHADASGFHASIHTNEPGVDPSRDPANVLINKEALVAAPAPVLVAPAPAPLPAALLPFAPLPAAPIAPLPAAPVFRAPVYAAKGYAEPVLAAPVQQVIEAPAPSQAFSYSFGATHPVLSYAAPPAPVAAAPEPIYQQSIKY